MISITDFKANVKTIAKSNRFLVDIFIDISVFKENPFAFLPNDFFEKLKYLVQDAAIPNRTQSSIPIKYHGMKLEIPGDFEHTDLVIKFINGQTGNNNWEVRRFFEVWMNLIQNIRTSNNRMDSISLLDLANITVTQIGLNEDEILASYIFNNIYPKELSEIKLSMGDENIQTFDVTFAYSHWDLDWYKYK
jgi:hypothetical protein